MNNLIVYSHFFTVQNAEIELRKMLYSMAADFTVFGMVWDERSRKKRWKPVKTFGFYTKQNDEFRFHNGQLPRVIDCAQRMGVELDVYHMPLYEPYKETYEINEKFTLREDQEEASAFILDNTHEGSHSPLLSMPMGSGKFQPLTAKILTPTGWSTMGDMVLGKKVLAKDGSEATVIGVYPQGEKQVWGFEFEDGRRTQSGADHLWAIYVNDASDRVVRTTTEIIELLQRSPDAKIEIDLPSVKLLDGISYYSRLMFLTEIPGITTQDGFNLQDFTATARAKEYKDHYVFLIRSLNGTAKAEELSDGKWRIHCKISAENRRIRLTKIHFVNGKVPCQCIAIDHPEHLYITDDFVVTHNTVTALISASRLENRLSVSVLAGYVDKWVSDLQETYHIAPKEIYKIDGGNKLIDYCQLVLENQETPEKIPRAVVISLNTMGRWFKKYMEDPYDPTLEMYGMKPWELMEKARVGTNIFDESHQHLHAVYRMFCFLHIPKTISLSATLTSTEQTELRIQNMMYPRHKRFENIKMKRYIEVYSCQYQITDIANARIRTTEYGSNNYSHTAFEKSVLSHRSIRKQYLDMIRRMVAKTFVADMVKGDKCAVFVSSHLMAREVCKLLRHEHPDLDIRTYLETDPLENLMVSDIRVTTVLSGGTAHDIKGLTVSIQTINLNSIRSNLQVLGRLREIAGKRCKFYYLYCASIPKHVEYHMNKIEIFKDWCKERKDLMLDALRP